MSTYDRILLVGSKGMLANAIRLALEARGHSVTGFDVPDIDITKSDSVDGIFDRVKSTLVINCAAYTNVDGCEKNRELADAVNGTGVGNLAIASKRHGATLVHYSTDYVFDGSLRRPLRPNDPVGPVSAYGKGKLLGEQLLQKNAPPRWLLLRTAWLYGPSGNNFPQAILNAAKAGKPLRVVADQFGSPTFTQDLAAATLNLLDTTASGIFHLTNSGDTNWADFARAVLDEFDVDKPVENITAADWKAIKPDSADRPAYSVLDISAYEKATGKPMPHWREALKRYHAAIG
ncbi:MAG: dTDP-4-dehydrorhamnose reductase [Tepidisphaeraceae bacterium]